MAEPQVRATAAQDAEPAHGTPPHAGALYDQDEYGWLLQQAGLLRAGRVGEVDRASLAEFLTDMARSHRHAFQGAMTVLLHHMLKVLVQPERATRSWLLAISVQQQQVQLVMDGNPGMCQHLPELCAKAYADARRRASIETGIALSRFPADNPWTLEAALAFAPPPPPPRAHRAARRG